jgi:hypothetical protein
VKVFRRFVYLGAYGGTTKKPTYIYSNNKHLLNTFNKSTMVSQPKVITSTVVIKDGRRHVTGTKALKSTQQYPEEFGAAVAESLQAMDADHDVMSNSGSEARLLMLVVFSTHA